MPAHRFVVRVGAWLLALAPLLAGCGGAGNPAPVTASDVNSAETVGHALPEGPLDLAELPPTPGSLAGFVVPSVRLPADLEGLGAGEIMVLLGPPRFARSDPPARLWQFRDERCILDVFLYRHADGAYRVNHAEVRGRGLHRPGERACMRALIGRTG